MRRSGYFIFAASVFAVAAVFALPTAHAEAPATRVLTITPAVQKPTLDPGTATSGNFQIINQGPQAYPVHAYSAPYSVQGENYTPDFTSLPGRPKVADWLKLTTTGSDIQPGHTLNVHFTLTIPKGTQPGGYYAVAFAETQAGKSKQGVIINERVGEIFYITVAGPVHKSGKLLTWSSPFLQSPPLGAELRLEDDGGLHYASDIHVMVSDVFGHTKYDLTTQKELLPQTIRRVPVSWNSAPPLGLFKVSGTATVLGKSQPLATKYVLVASQTVRLVFAGLVAVLVAFAVGRSMTRRRANRRTEQKPQS